MSYHDDEQQRHRRYGNHGCRNQFCEGVREDEEYMIPYKRLAIAILVHAIREKDFDFVAGKRDVPVYNLLCDLLPWVRRAASSEGT